jgi:hypothetical protein
LGNWPRSYNNQAETAAKVSDPVILHAMQSAGRFGDFVTLSSLTVISMVREIALEHVYTLTRDHGHRKCSSEVGTPSNR